VKKSTILIILILVCSIFLYFFQTGGRSETLISSSNSKIVFLGNKRFDLETATTPSEQEQGLSGRELLCSDCAMLFVFNKKDVYHFWMKGMEFDLDMLWIDDTKIVQIDKNVTHLTGAAETRESKIAIDKVLEINAGESDKLGLKVGDKAVFK
jgi:uncharacterized protein